MKRHIRPVAKANGIHKKIGWHTFRHSFGTLLKANGEDVTTVQELLRHANSRITLDVYTQAVNSNKRTAQSKVVKTMVSSEGMKGAGVGTIDSVKQAPKLCPDLVVTVGSHLILSVLECMVGTTGLEPATSAVKGHRKAVTYRK